jgi:hypothetical protein
VTVIIYCLSETVYFIRSTTDRELCHDHKFEMSKSYLIYLRNFCTFWPIFSSKNGGAKIMRGMFGRHCFRGDLQVRSRIKYPIHKLEMKCFSIII